MTYFGSLRVRDRGEHGGGRAGSPVPGAERRGRMGRVARRLGPAAVALASLAACSGQQASVDQEEYARRQPDATVELRQVQVAYLGSGAYGTGQLFYQGKVYPFKVGGLGVGGIGASTVEASGNVYNLTDIRQFPGIYVQGRVGFALGTASAGHLWLKNDNGVVLNLQAKRTGLMLSLGGDAVRISMDAAANPTPGAASMR